MARTPIGKADDIGLETRVRRVIEGSPSRPRLLQDIAVEAEVWLEYARRAGAEQPLLIVPFDGISAGDAARQLRARLKAIGCRGPVASLQGLIAARLDAGAFIRGVLPALGTTAVDGQWPEWLAELAALFGVATPLPDLLARPSPGAPMAPDMAFLGRISPARSLDRAGGVPLPNLASALTIKADAAVRLFGVSCRNIGWAVADGGIRADHPAFINHESGGSRVVHRFDFVNLLARLSGIATGARPEVGAAREAVKGWLRELEPDLDAAALATRARAWVRRLTTRLQQGRDLDWDLLLPIITVTDPRAGASDHGTAVAAIIAGDWRVDPKGLAPPPPDGGYAGVCPDILLTDLRVLPGDADGPVEGGEFDLIGALQFLRWWNARSDARRMQVHGVNLSLAVPHRVASYACGATPVCIECDRLNAAGVLVVAAAGNHGHSADGPMRDLGGGYAAISITDPGNARHALTVGATHAREPHRFGVSYFSGRGPTADGRAKPDLVAPGERIGIVTASPGGLSSDSGTSFAAPHASGAAALLIARHPELAGQPGTVKQLLCAAATDLGRERSFQGAGLLDALRALQAA